MRDYLAFDDEELALFIKKHKGTIHTREFPTRCGICRFFARFKAVEAYCEYLDDRAAHSFGSEGILLHDNWLKTAGKEFAAYDCSTENCKRPVVAYEWGDHWCEVDLKRVAKLRGEELK